MRSVVTATLAPLRFRMKALFVAVLGLCILVGPVAHVQAAQSQRSGAAAGTANLTYKNPLLASIPGNKNTVQTCADPSIMYAKKQKAWFVYCTSDQLFSGDPVARVIPILKSTDLSHFTYVASAMSATPYWVKGNGLWAPDIHFFNGKYYLYYTAPDTQSGGSAIGVGISQSPIGPFKDAGTPVVEAHAPPCCPNDKMWTFDPAVVKDGGQLYIFYGSYYGGIQARKLSADGLHSDAASQTQITIDNHYEGAFPIKHGAYWYLFTSSGPCCSGALSGYTTFVGRSTSVLGPYLDRDGVSMLAGRTGGLPVIYANGNGFVGTGHNAVFTDFNNRTWTIYHAIDQTKPFLNADTQVPSRRPLMMDPLDWIDGWPALRGGLGPSNTAMPVPAAQPGKKDRYIMQLDTPPATGTLLPNLSDDFNGNSLSSQWSWVRQPKTPEYSLTDGTLQWKVEDTDLFESNNTASILTEPAPAGNYMVELKVKMTMPAEGCCWNYQQGGVVVMKDDDNYIRATSASEWGTRYVEFGKEWNPPPVPNWPRYGAGWWSPVGDWTWIRVYKTGSSPSELYTLYLSIDGTNWRREYSWTHDLGPTPRIGLVSMGRDPNQNAAVNSVFDYIHVYKLAG